MFSHCRTGTGGEGVTAAPAPVRDLSYGEALLAVRWHEVQYACQQKVYPRKAFSEQMPGLQAGAVESLPT